MSREILEGAIRSVFNCEQAFCKFLSANDAGATGAHQAGILISLKASTMLFRENLQNENILKRIVKITLLLSFYILSSHSVRNTGKKCSKTFTPSIKIVPKYGTYQLYS